MREIDSTTCSEDSLLKQIEERFSSKLLLYGEVCPNILFGEYESFPRSAYSSSQDYYDEKTFFCCKYYKNEFLRVTVSNGFSRQSLGHKLAVLSDFYEVLQAQFGIPTVFYTIKDDMSEALHLQWSIKNKEDDITEFREGRVFQDVEIDKVIVFGEKNSSLGTISAKEIVLPMELLLLVNENREDFLFYKSDRNCIRKLDIGTSEEISIEKQKIFTKKLYEEDIR